MKRKAYEKALAPLQVELNALAHWLRHSGQRVVVLMEGRDTAGKGGTINAITQRLNPRQVHVVALPRPDERERSQWYFQRYVQHLPSAGELVLFDRSWYNRAGVEPVMGFCTPQEHQAFLREAPVFERALVDSGIRLVKYWLSVDQAKQEERFAERAADPRKRWKLSPVDLQARRKYREYGEARDLMLEHTHTPYAPWTLVDFNDQRAGRLNLIQHLLDQWPDRRLEAEPVTLEPLPGPPGVEEFRGPVKPIVGAY